VPAIKAKIYRSKMDAYLKFDNIPITMGKGIIGIK
jgi:hypothetical protein